MADERSRLLSGCVINIPKGKDEYKEFGDSHFNKTMSLSIEELMPFQDDPWWQNLRRTFFLSFWITVIVIFASACILSVLQHGSCAVMNNKTPSTTMMVPVISISTLTSSIIVTQ